jgi:SAM-dependent methyltransferase
MKWNDEYRRAGMPSSSRDTPSSTVVWAFDNWSRLGGGDAPRRGLDVGCGTARNTVYAANRGTRMIGFDSSEVAIAQGRERVARDAGGEAELLVHDLRSGLPAGGGEIDIALDVFVYKHQVEPAARRSYRAELLRVLAPTGRLLISLAEPHDGYYAACPPSTTASASPNAIRDPIAGIDSVLFSLDALAAEMEDGFQLEMAWHKQQHGTMHGREYARRTLATLWRPLGGHGR